MDKLVVEDLLFSILNKDGMSIYSHMYFDKYVQKDNRILLLSFNYKTGILTSNTYELHTSGENDIYDAYDCADKPSNVENMIQKSIKEKCEIQLKIYNETEINLITSFKKFKKIFNKKANSGYLIKFIWDNSNAQIGFVLIKRDIGEIYMIDLFSIPNRNFYKNTFHHIRYERVY